MEKFFNTAGPIIPEDHYYISSFERIDWEEIQHLIKQKRYFILHAPRQTGKTSALLEMMAALNAVGQYHALYANIEVAQVTRNDVQAGIRTICGVIADSVRHYLQDERLVDWYQQNREKIEPQDFLRQMLAHWAEISDRPVVLFLDEVDALVGDTLISLLRQFRSGYNQRPGAFPQTIVLCGLRDIKDYRIHRSDGEIITGGSAFNIKAESLRLGNFIYDEVVVLYAQHTEATGQLFAEGIIDEVWLDSNGQPWLVNAIGHEMTWKDRSARDRSTLITMVQYRAARERLIQSRATHLDQLTDKLREPRVQRVIAPLLEAEEGYAKNASVDDLQYVEDLGLIVSRPRLRISNRIYQEIIPRELTWVMQSMLVTEEIWYVTPDNHLDMKRLLTAFQQFFRESSESWLERFDYKEAGPQLLMQAFLQRVINGGGRINREYGLGRRRTDLAIEWPVDKDKGYHGEVHQIVIELKILRGNLDTVISKGLEQTADYADTFNADEAHLIVFNRDPAVSWGKKIWHRNEAYDERSIVVWGC